MRKRQRADIYRDIWRRRSCLGESILPATPIAQAVMATATATTTWHSFVVRRSEAI